MCIKHVLSALYTALHMLMQDADLSASAAALGDLHRQWLALDEVSITGTDVQDMVQKSKAGWGHRLNDAVASSYGGPAG